MIKDMSLEEGDEVEFWDGYSQKWEKGVIKEVDPNDTKYPYLISEDDGDAEFWGNSEHGVRKYGHDYSLGETIVPNYITEKIEGHEDEGDKPDMVEHPPHYNQHPKGIECIEVIEDNPFILLGNAMKYLWRVSWGGKGNDLEDLKKAVWYIQREITRRENAS